MTLHVCVLGTDGSGKTSLAASLPMVLAAETGLRAGSAGETFTVFGPDEDHLAPKFHPEGFPLSARLAEWFKRLAKRAVDHRTFYPALKLAHMVPGLCGAKAGGPLRRRRHGERGERHSLCDGPRRQLSEPGQRSR